MESSTRATIFSVDVSEPVGQWRIKILFPELDPVSCNASDHIIGITKCLAAVGGSFNLGWYLPILFQYFREMIHPIQGDLLDIYCTNFSSVFSFNSVQAKTSAIAARPKDPLPAPTITILTVCILNYDLTVLVPSV